MNEAKLKAFMLSCMELLLEANKHGNSSVEIECDPAKVFGINASAGKFMVVISAGQSAEKLKAALAQS